MIPTRRVKTGNRDSRDLLFLAFSVARGGICVIKTKSMRRLQNAIPAYSHVLIGIYYACIFCYAIVGYKTPA